MNQLIHLNWGPVIASVEVFRVSFGKLNIEECWNRMDLHNESFQRYATETTAIRRLLEASWGPIEHYTVILIKLVLPYPFTLK